MLSVKNIVRFNMLRTIFKIIHLHYLSDKIKLNAFEHTHT